MIAGASCTSMSLAIPPAPGSCSNCEKLFPTIPRDLLDHVIDLDERHLKRLVSEYVSYYHDDRTHLGLDKQTPASRAHSRGKGTVICQQRVGGLHHRYDWAA